MNDTMDKRFAQAVNRINKINLNNSYDIYRKSDLILAKEYIRRAALFMDYLGKDCKFISFRAADILNKTQIIDFKLVCPQLEMLDSRSEKNICKYHLEWIYLAEHEDLLALKFEDLYERFESKYNEVFQK